VTAINVIRFTRGPPSRIKARKAYRCTGEREKISADKRVSGNRRPPKIGLEGFQRAATVICFLFQRCGIGYRRRFARGGS
jgi:hypothetical protein